MTDSSEQQKAAIRKNCVNLRRLLAAVKLVGFPTILQEVGSIESEALMASLDEFPAIREKLERLISRLKDDRCRGRREDYYPSTLETVFRRDLDGARRNKKPERDAGRPATGSDRSVRMNRHCRPSDEMVQEPDFAWLGIIKPFLAWSSDGSPHAC